MGGDKKRILGLDLGANSLGWALINQSQQKIIASGVRIFPEGVEDFEQSKEQSKNVTRRVKRGMRRQTKRRARRNRQVRDLLQRVGLLPATGTFESKTLFETDPYELRSRAISEKLALHEIGRALLHLSQRRGFLSNRKTDRANDKENSKIKQEINELASEIKSTNSQTLGNFFATLRKESAKREEPIPRIRNRHTNRQMYIDEYELIWKTQQKYFPGILTQALHDELYGLIFYQRNLYWKKATIGLCELEPKEKRCARADRVAQKFRLLTEINNLRFIDPAKGREEKITAYPDLYEKLYNELLKRKEMSFDQIRKKLGFLENVTFNYETQAERKKLLGMPTDAAMANKNIFGKDWYEKPEEERDEIISEVIKAEGSNDDIELLRKAEEEWKATPEAAKRLLTLPLPSGQAKLSRKAMKRLIPYLRRGLPYVSNDETPSALSEVGYLRPDQRLTPKKDMLTPPPEISNPVVRQALFEVRTVVNAIIREFGPFKATDEIHIELARNAKANSVQRKKILQRNKQRETQHEEAAQFCSDQGELPNRENRIRYLLWKEQGQICPYSGKRISCSQLFSSETDIDHILPRSRTLDDSQSNKVLCFRKMNHEKGNLTPYEWRGTSDPEAYEKMLQCTRSLPYRKRERFTRKELDTEGFIARQLNDTRYISRKVVQYAGQLFDNPAKNIICVRGEQTAKIRRLLGLNNILALDSSIENLDLDPGEKNRADHRHHAVDALAVAMTSRATLQKIAKWYDDDGSATSQSDSKRFPLPWSTFREDARRSLNQINVSYKVHRKVSGPLHEETIYGPTFDHKGQQKNGQFVIRKKLEGLTSDEILCIRDEKIREIVLDRLSNKGVSLEKKKLIFPKGLKMKEVFNDDHPLVLSEGTRKNPHPTIVKKVRVLKKDATIEPLQTEETQRDKAQATHFVKPGNTHHICIFEWDENGKRKRDAVFVTLLEASKRLREQNKRIKEEEKKLRKRGISKAEFQKQLRAIRRQVIQEVPLISRQHPDRPEAKYMFSISKGELVLMEIDGEEDLFRFVTGASTQGQLYFNRHTVSGRQVKPFAKKANTLPADIKKVTVDPIGRIRWAND